MDKVIPVKVAIRIRPLSNKENEEGCQSVVQVVPNRPQIYLPSLEKAFTFDFAFGAGSTQKTVYDESSQDMIVKLFEGYNTTVLAYGQTGSGKTHSMGTSYQAGQAQSDPALAGIIQRAVGDIFAEIAKRRHELDVRVRVAFVELYREQLYDLLSPKSHKKEDCVCDLREDPTRGVVIPGLTEESVESLDHTMDVLTLGSTKRVTAATAMNNTSSRSHAIFTVFLNMIDQSGQSTLAKFHLVDLAGSERAKKTKATGDRMKEGVAINQGLLALGNVIAALGEDRSGPSSHVPYRNSKLTRLLQDSLGGNSYTLMLACVSPADSNLEETLNTLRYADRARKIKNKPIVNLDGADQSAEVQRLRLENQELKLQMVRNAVGVVDSEETQRLQEQAKRMRDENKELTNALVACQDELAHINEKALMLDASNAKLKTKLKELLAEAKVLSQKEGLDVAGFSQKVADIVHLQADAEKTIMDLDMAHADGSQWQPHDHSSSGGEDDEDGGDDDEFGAARALKQNALTTQLQNLNKMLAQKERLASDMFANDEKLQEMKKKYEETLAAIEGDMNKLIKEKEELSHQQKHTGNDPTCKISEQRRKRIQDLEHQIQDLKKKMLEQQKAIKMNEKNAAQVKKLSEDITQMKQTKVKLIKQIREDAEKVRVWKQQKEKEVIKLKQAERKQQVKIAKMETLHTKQQTVLKRKMEEAISINKRLKEVIDKQKASRAMIAGRSGLAGAGDRVRTLINEDLDVVVSVKEATKSREQLLNDRKTITKQLNDIKKDMRGTMNTQDIVMMKTKTEELQAELDIQNAQIAALQKQITDLEHDNKDVNNNRFDNLRTMTEAKIALDHLFDKTVEQTVSASQLKSEFEELRQLYQEAVRNTNTLEKEIADLKNEFETDNLKLNRAHEEKVLFLLGNLANANDSERLKIHEQEIRNFSKLHAELEKMGEENEKLRQQMLGEAKMVSKENNLQSSRASKVANQSGSKGRYTVEEYFNHSLEDDSEIEEDREDNEDDPDWQKTPLFKRIKKVREARGNSFAPKRKYLGDHDSTGSAISTEDDDEETPPAKRRSKNNRSNLGCQCKTDCSSNKCGCKKGGASCNESCRCVSSRCINKDAPDPEDGAGTSGPTGTRTILGDLSNSDSLTDTFALLNDTYTATTTLKPGRRTLDVQGMRSPQKTERTPYFKSPLSEETEESHKSPRTGFEKRGLLMK
ncbi:hypothetical protein TCAL_03053 [Tigriopus californicus]|uniref:Kinesin motor domain-containing protein n=1 Tax=Tigriopus californicus TaxID=6832 RepID=A0A553NSG7_TIGCA|nr:chromosome-associated kinesin KIF4A-like [Tigriopus californicus]TRY68349.1 hypothetical protein TCAL_03053 [Tigriopus californicus]|eukprot:TCALIF_03053-PA protein Name:"Similar to kif4 Chromosome-associated kinesin KIF4 (Xenopus laevis)" AED:0.01 eAED:0.01 QI:298/1/0.5/1/1/0.5/2/0/1208